MIGYPSAVYVTGRGVKDREAWRATAAASSVQGGGLDCRFGAGHGEERTRNMRNMLVTLEVSKLSDWLSANAYCRESKGGHIRCGATTADF